MTMTSMAKELVKDNFDINVWNRGAYFEEEKAEWVLCPYKLDWDGDNYSISDEMDEHNLVLTDAEAWELTLGWGPELGGDYIDEDDFWLDANSFKETYKDIPERVKVWLDFVTHNL